MMNWGLGDGVNDFLVPKDHEILDRFPLSESWLQWGKCDYESMESLSRNIVPQKNLNQAATMGNSSHYTQNDRSSSSGILSEGSSHLCAIPQGQPSFLLGTDQIDDISLRSLLDEDLPDMDSVNESFGFPLEFSYSSMSTNDPLTGTISDSLTVPSHFCGINNSKCLETYDLSTSQVVKGEECSATHSTLSSHEKQKCFPVTEASSIQFGDQAVRSEELGEEASSAHESVLWELKGVMSQLTQKTRICFRDALYRLAKNSEQKHLQTEDTLGSLADMPAVDEIPRSGARRATELETNVIDRAVANLMFSKMELRAPYLSQDR